MLAKLPPYLSVPIFYILMTLAYIYRLFFGNIYGIFAISIVVYFSSEWLFGIAPLSFDGLMEWVVNQSETTKAALLGSIIAVIGFMVAYATATSNWKSQLLANLKIQAAGEIAAFFTECTKLATGCEIYAGALVKAVNEIQKGCPNDKAELLAHYNREGGHLFKQQRDRLLSLGVEVHLLGGKYGTLLSTSPGLMSEMGLATKALENITDKLWINVPYHIQNDPNPVQTFLNQVNVTECIALIDSVNKNYDMLTSSSGDVRGRLTSDVVGYNFWMIFNLFKDPKGIKELFADRYKNLKKTD